MKERKIKLIFENLRKRNEREREREKKITF